MKNRSAIYCLFFLISLNYKAQTAFDSLIQAEKNFAAYAVANGTKEAFLKFLDSTGIVFDNGKPVNGIALWAKREKRPGVLNWQPQFAEISVSGDWGYTTGPWTFQNSITDSVVARGQYTTVWQRDKNGEWKFLVDLGVNNVPENLMQKLTRIDIKKYGSAKGISPHVSPVISSENRFIKSVAKNKNKAYDEFLSNAAILNRNGNLPSTGTALRDIIESTPSAIQYKAEGWRFSARHDMGFVYGTAIISGKTENYLRIWRNQKEGWKIAVEVLRY